jgi:hypothetical protein
LENVNGARASEGFNKMGVPFSSPTHVDAHEGPPKAVVGVQRSKNDDSAPPGSFRISGRGTDSKSHLLFPFGADAIFKLVGF